jgi:two-component system chemotaxis response regulator CheB
MLDDMNGVRGDGSPLPPLIRAPATFPVGVPVLALVTSAGGLNALTQVLAPLSARLPAAVLIAQHRDPAAPVDNLAAILDRHSAMPVRAARDGDHLQVGTVLVTPAATHLIVTSNAELALLETGDLPPARPSADLLLATLAVTAGPGVLAVVLTGTGHDAQAGIRAVHRCGGTVFAQDQASAEHFGMPSAAIATGLVHAIHPLPELAAAITAHLTTRAQRPG